MIQRIPITDRKQWLDLRKKDVTASAVGCLLDVHDYLTPLELWAHKTGRLGDAEDNPAMKRGRLLEPVAIELIREKHPDWAIWIPREYLRDPDRRIGATPDLYVKKPDGRTGIVQIKTTADLIFKQKWQDKDTRDIVLPLWIAVQAMTEQELSGADFAIVALMVVGMGLDLHEIDVPLHSGVLKRRDEAVAAFWKLTDSGAPMPPDYARDGETIGRIYDSGGEPPLDLRGDNLFADAIARYESNKAIIKAAEAAKDEAAAEIKFKMGNHEVANSSANVVNWKLIKRAAYEVKAGEYRRLTIK